MFQQSVYNSLMMCGLEWTKKREGGIKQAGGILRDVIKVGWQVRTCHIISYICEIRHCSIEQNIAVYLWVSSNFHWPPLFLGSTQCDRKPGILRMTIDSTKMMWILCLCCIPDATHSEITSLWSPWRHLRHFKRTNYMVMPGLTPSNLYLSLLISPIVHLILMQGCWESDLQGLERQISHTTGALLALLPKSRRKRKACDSY